MQDEDTHFCLSLSSSPRGGSDTGAGTIPGTLWWDVAAEPSLHTPPASRLHARAAVANEEKSSSKVLTRALGSIRGALHPAPVSQLSQLSAGFTRLLGNRALLSTVNKSDKL